jgi:hypothetical protein
MNRDWFMRIFDFFLFRQKPSDASFEDVSPNFKINVQKAIELIGQSEGSLEDKGVLHLFTKNGIESSDATAILMFLPIAFVRHLLPKIKWPDSYVEHRNQKNSDEIKYAETKSYLIISEITANYFKNSPDSNAIIKIAGRSAEFQVINKLLLDSPNIKLEEIELTKNIIVR